MKLLVATRNDGKAREIRELFAGLPFQLVFPQEQFLERLPEEGDLEQGMSFAENAVAKARYFAKRSGLPTVAEDSGLEVDGLEGAPGVHSARYAHLYGEAGRGKGEGELDAANNALLLERLAGVPEERRTARGRCVAGLVGTPTAAPQLVEAATEGRALTEPRRARGVGYDPLFFSTDLRVGLGPGPPP